MKTLSKYINESISFNKRTLNQSIQQTSKDELKKIITDRISKEGFKCDLNDIDTSLIDDMSGLFIRLDFNGDISK